MRSASSNPVQGLRLLHVAGFALLIVLLGLVPCTVLFLSVDSGDSLLRTYLLKIPVFFCAGWAVVSLWAALDIRRLTEIIGRKTDPLCPEGHWIAYIGTLELRLSHLVSVPECQRSDFVTRGKARLYHRTRKVRGP